MGINSGADPIIILKKTILHIMLDHTTSEVCFIYGEILSPFKIKGLFFFGCQSEISRFLMYPCKNGSVRKQTYPRGYLPDFFSTKFILRPYAFLIYYYKYFKNCVNFGGGNESKIKCFDLNLSDTKRVLRIF